MQFTNVFSCFLIDVKILNTKGGLKEFLFEKKDVCYL